MNANLQPGESIGTLLEALRVEKGFTKLSLAETSGVSATYIAMIETGTDSRTGKEIRPSPDTLRKLASALSRDNPAEARRLYIAMMAVLDYLPDDDQLGGATSEAILVVLSDDRLDTHFRSVMERWPSLSTAEQAAILALFKLIDQNSRRR